jgi:hypothetical protein
MIVAFFDKANRIELANYRSQSIRMNVYTRSLASDDSISDCCARVPICTSDVGNLEAKNPDVLSMPHT